jgi:transcriptional regulator with XRE-family HTH domain
MSQDTTQAHPAYQGLPADLTDQIFARRLRVIRQAAGMTQQQLAELTGMHRSAIAKIEAGGRVVSVGEAVQLAAALGTTVAELAADPADGADRARVEAQVRLRSAEHEAARRHELMEEARLLYMHALEAAEDARQQLAALDGED